MKILLLKTNGFSMDDCKINHSLKLFKRGRERKQTVNKYPQEPKYLVYIKLNVYAVLKIFMRNIIFVCMQKL